MSFHEYYSKLSNPPSEHVGAHSAEQESPHGICCIAFIYGGAIGGGGGGGGIGIGIGGGGGGGALPLQHAKETNYLFS